jgi:hypothetical protein
MAKVMDLPPSKSEVQVYRYIANFMYISFAAAVYVIGMGGEGGWSSDCLDFQGPPLEMDLIYFKIMYKTLRF